MKNITKAIAMMIFSFYSFNSKGQNLVPNPGFEDTVICPIGLSEIDRAVGWNTFSNTPDYFNSCDNGQAGIPSNLFGFQAANSGNAYSGIYTFHLFGNSYREVIGIHLSQSLIIGQMYFVSFFASHAANLDISVKTGIATNKLGSYFSTVPYDYLNPIAIANIAEVFSDSIITDTLNWVRISGTFIADSAYEYLCIGNFFTDSMTLIQLDSIAVSAYYYIDDVCVSTDSTNCLFNPEEVEVQNAIKAIKIFPNPTEGWVDIEGTDIRSLSVYDILGNLYYSKKILSSSRLSIDYSNLGKGIYFLHIQTSKETAIQKIIIQ
ncbi:MAG: T9SS type A sorting domain-containing protein [Bacteroidota bacterium]